MAYYQRFQAYRLDQDDYVSAMESREDSSHPGKFESTPPYVSYMWDRMLAWGDLPDDDATSELWEAYGYTPPTDDDGGFDIYGDYCDMPEVYRYTVTMLDRLYFPELDNVSSVYLYESDQGFVEVYEIRTSDNENPLDFWGL